MATFNDLPLELKIEIFSYLTRRDLISSSMVCTAWRHAVDSSALWKNFTVYLDSDLMDPSTVIATGQYHAHFKEMEFCWTNPRFPSRWIQHALQEFSKRAWRYIMILQNSYVQLRSIKIVDWYEVPKFKKITYHLCKFLRSQVNLTRVSFTNVNFTKTECVKLLVACLSSLSTIKYLETSYCHHASPSVFESVSFISCIEHLSNLCVLKLDYTVLCPGILEAIITSRNTGLKLLDVTVRDHDRNRALVPEQTWANLHKQCPELKVSMHLKNVCHFDDVYMLLKETMPLSAFSLSCGRTWDQTRSRQYRRTILLLMKNYCKTLESIHLQMNYNREVVDDLILALIHKCVNLKRFNFHGVISSMELLQEISRMQVDHNENGFKYFHIFPRNINLESHYILSKLHEDFARTLDECDVDFKICNTFNKNLVYVYY